MSFTRYFDIQKKELLRCSEIYKSFEREIIAGEVFPAIRMGSIDFYYKGGVLYRYSGKSFKRNPNYKHYGGDIKQQNEMRHTRSSGAVNERQLLGNLYAHTFGSGKKSNVIVLDIEVNLTGPRGKKCDMLLLNTTTNELMFVEGKVFGDGRVNTEKERPEVIDQIESYNRDIAGDTENIINQYCNYVEIINELFDKDYERPTSLINRAKLLVYAAPERPLANGQRSINAITEHLGKENIYWVKGKYEPSISEIWNELTESSHDS